MARGTKQVSQIAQAVCELQNRLPRARTLYMSATGATEVSNLAYAQRLGLWGSGTAFNGKLDFVQQVSAGGVAAMELVARDMKQLGLYMSRGLSFDGVEYERLEHQLSADQTTIYDKLCEAWQITLRNFDKALELTASMTTKDGVRKVSQKAKAKAYSAFWGSHQRFFNQLICAIQMPTVLANMERELAAGNCCVLQLVNTNEASMDRALADLDEDDDLSDLDITPRDQLMQLVEHCFPVVQHETFLDKNTNKASMRVAEDSKGNTVLNATAVAMRDKLLNDLASVRCPDAPLEMVLNHFGHHRVAEVTGRTRRVVRVTENGTESTVMQTRSPVICMKEANDFQDGHRDILIFSDAGGTGASYHADTTRKNQRRRIHYLIQAGWVADQAVQGFGRTHRSRQACPPLYKLCCTSLKGHRRFLSTIARRLDQLGALTKGQRQAFISNDVADDGKMSGFFTAADNLESHWARQALLRFFRDLHENKVDGISIGEFEHQTGLKLRDDEGKLLQQLPPITRFLNRLLSLRVDAQAFTFDAFDERLRATIAQAEAAGTLDMGVETVKADKIEKVSQKVVYRHPSGAETSLVRFKLSHSVKPVSFDELMEQRQATRWQRILFFATNARSGHVYAFVQASDRTLSNGSIEPCYHEIGPDSRRLVAQKDIRDGDFDARGKYHLRWTRLELDDPEHMRQARDQWNRQYVMVPRHRESKLALLTGLILPVYDRLPNGENVNVRVQRLQTVEGERFLGRVIEEQEIHETLKKFGVGCDDAQLTPASIVSMLDSGQYVAKLANGWTIKRTKTGIAHRLELVGPDYRDGEQIRRWGVTEERIDFRLRYWVGPVRSTVGDDNAEAIVASITADKPVLEMTRVQRSVAA